MADVSEMRPAEVVSEAIGEADLEAIERYNIIQVPSMSYLVGPYRYSKLTDALAQAKRDANVNHCPGSLAEPG